MSETLDIKDLSNRISKLPSPPKPFGCPYSYKVSLPGEPGIYFLWEEGQIAYVGKSVDLSRRIGSLFGKHHHAFRDGDLISWLTFNSKKGLEFTESFYIWLCRPYRNFGGLKRKERSEALRKAEINRPKREDFYPLSNALSKIRRPGGKAVTLRTLKWYEEIGVIKTRLIDGETMTCDLFVENFISGYLHASFEKKREARLEASLKSISLYAAQRDAKRLGLG